MGAGAITLHTMIEGEWGTFPKKTSSKLFRLSVASAALALLSDETGGALAGVEGAAAGSAFAIVGAIASDELGACRLAGRTDALATSTSSGSGSSSSSSSTAEVEDLTNLQVGAASIDGWVGGNDSGSGGATGIGDSRASITSLDGDGSTSTSTSSGCSGSWGGLSWDWDTGGTGSVGALDSDRSAVVGDGLSEATSTVTGLSDDGTGALASGEGAAVGCAIEVLGAGTSDELGAVGNTGEDRRGSDEGKGSENESSTHYDVDVKGKKREVFGIKKDEV
jgi:hypothetical protein